MNFLYLQIMKHNGMRPHDIVVLCQIAVSNDEWKSTDIAASLFISPAEISYSLQRSGQAGLIDLNQRKVFRRTLLDFVRFGLPFVFPAVRGPIMIGVPTAYSAPVIKKFFGVREYLVWEHEDGTERGESIAALYPNAPKAALANREIYDTLALLDVMRIGKVREKEIALNLLHKKFNTKYA